jgi:hypothetical protein
MTPATDEQVSYIQQLLARLVEKADWHSLDNAGASGVIDQLNAIRKRVGVPFEPMEGLVSNDGPRRR